MMKGNSVSLRSLSLCLLFSLLLFSFCMDTRSSATDGADKAESAVSAAPESAEEPSGEDASESSLGEDEEDSEEEDENEDEDFSSLFGSLGGGGFGRGLDNLQGMSGLFDNLGTDSDGEHKLGNLASLLPNLGMIGKGGGDGKEELAELLSKASAQQNSGTNQVSPDFVNQIFSMLSKNNTALNDIMSEFMQDPYMDIKETERPKIDPEVFANPPAQTDNAAGNARDGETPESSPAEAYASDAATADGPEEIILSKIKKFVKKPGDRDADNAAADPFAETNDAGVCHILVLSGGGARSAFQAGGIVGLAEQYKAQGRELKWDVVTGVGFGGVQAAFGLPFKPGHNGELDYGESLWRFWQGLKKEDILKCENGMKDLMDIRATMQWIQKSQKYASNVAKLLKVPLPHPCDTAPLAATLKNYLSKLAEKSEPAPDDKEPRVAVLTAAKLGGGRHTWTLLPSQLETKQCKSEDGSPCSEGSPSQSAADVDTRAPVLVAMAATAAIPGTFPPVALPNAKGKLEGMIDGAVNSFLNVLPGVSACQERVKRSKKNPFSDEEVAQGKGIVLDFVLSVEADKPNTEGTMADEEEEEEDNDLFDNTGVPLENLALLKEKFPALTIRHVIAPDDTYELAHDLMDLRSTQALLELGRIAGWGAQVYAPMDEEAKSEES
ncbi:phospholipase, patatin family protein [Toxoplasma gondii RUB]|uniref:Phospholipase, patatin family protein n=2 Tax=Toxoplasma gondii TaxID=5811 RepID=A0A086M4K5_TOXGO|nr:phospholipase, patatin family protein [Toxoplasma gondii RUB]RQX75770.1 phospholipase, patatin family protein [Toxoplasma gondii CAST]